MFDLMLYIIILVVILAFVQGVLALRKNKFLGLILPGLVLILAATTLSLHIINTSILLGIVLAVYLAIYFICRAKVKKTDAEDISKMKISDL